MLQLCKYSYWYYLTLESLRGISMFRCYCTLFIYKQRFFSTQLQMLLRCCLIHTSIIILKHFLYLLFLCPCQDLGLFMAYLCYCFFIFIFIFIVVNRIISRVQTRLFFAYFLEYIQLFFNDSWYKEWKFSLRVLLSICLIFCQF